MKQGEQWRYPGKFYALGLPREDVEALSLSMTILQGTYFALEALQVCTSPSFYEAAASGGMGVVALVV